VCELLWKTPVFKFITGELGHFSLQMYLCAMFTKPKLAIQDFDYPLPDSQIAYHPAPNRADSKLLIWDQAIIGESTYAQIAQYIPSNATLIFNNSKVIAARIFFEKNETSTIEIFCLEPTENYIPVLLAMQATKKVEWHCLVGGAKKWKEDTLQKKVDVNGLTIHFSAKKIQQADGKFVIEFSWDHPSITFSEILTSIGNIPLPPYIQRKANEDDKDRYQTTYANEEGSVAAPTAGLHFSKEVFKSLSEKNIFQKYLTLHVGAGTFMPVKSATIDEHDMHAEFIEVDLSLLVYLKENVKQFGALNKASVAPIIAVGTTSLRTLESVYWIGAKSFIYKKNNSKALPIAEMNLGQWDAYELAEQKVTVEQSMNALIESLQEQQCHQLIAKTQLIVTPGYQFKICDGLITNFHQPKSTLLLIIAAITGEKWKSIYTHALANQYRFLSYGDGSLFWIKQQEV
jgi:S-adenosylmethionine:tRNA ribosyltransferase-isomerase